MIYSVYIYIVNIRGSNAQKKKKKTWMDLVMLWFFPVDGPVDGRSSRENLIRCVH